MIIKLYIHTLIYFSEPEAIVKHEQTAIHSLLWSLVLHYQFGYTPNAGVTEETTVFVLQQFFLTWIEVRNRTGLPVTNLSTDWNDGQILTALCEYCKPGQFASSVKGDDAASKIQSVMQLAEEHFIIPQVISPSDFAADRPDERSVMIYLSYFVRQFSVSARTALKNWIKCRAIPPAPESVEVSEIQMQEIANGGEHVWVLLDCSGAGYGTPSAKVERRNNAGTIPVHISEMEEEKYGTDKYIVKFVPPESDIYDLSIFYGDRHVTGSPFTVNLQPSNPKGVKHIETKHDAKHVSMIFDTKEAGRGKIKARASGELIGYVPIKCSEESDGTYEITFVPPFSDIYNVDVCWGKFSADATGKSSGIVPLCLDQDKKSECKLSFKPPTPDVYTVNLKWEEKPVPGSPFKINRLLSSQPKKVKCRGCFHPLSDESILIMIFDASNAGSGELKARCVGETAKEVRVNVIEIYRYTFQVTFEATIEDIYRLYVQFDNKDVEGSPFVFDTRRIIKELEPPDIKIIDDVNEMTPNASHRELITRFIGEKLRFEISPRDDAQRKGKINVSVNGKESSKEVTQAQNDDGVFEVCFNPDEPGQYELKIQLNGVDIPRSPVDVRYFLCPYLVLNSEEEIAVDKKVVHCIDLRDQDLNITQFSFKCIGNASTEEVEVKRVQNSITFLPTAPDQYTLSVYYEGREIKNSSVKVNYLKTRMKRERVEGINLKGETFQTGIQYKFQVKYSKVQKGQLDVSCSVPSAADIALTPLTDQKAYECVFMPSQVGDYQISVMYNGYHIEGSPFNVNFHSPPQTSVSFSLNAEGAETSGISATVQSATNHTELPVKLSQLCGGQYSFAFVPTQDLEYLVTIKCRVKIAAQEKEVAGSPFSLSYVKTPVDASKCVQEFEGSEKVGKTQSLFEVQSIASEGVISHQRQPNNPSEGQPLQFILTSKVEKQFKSSEHVAVAQIAVQEKEVAGFPFSLSYVKTPVDASKCVLEFEGDGKVGKAQLGLQNTFFVLTEGAGHGQLNVSIDGPDVKPEVAVREVSPTKIEVKYVLHCAGNYRIALTWDSEPIPGSPFEVQCVTLEGVVSVIEKVKVTWSDHPVERTPLDASVIQTSRPKKVDVKGPGLQDGYLGEQANITIDTSEAGSGTLSVNVEGPKGGFKVNLSRHPENEHVIIADYNPQLPGQYVINILWSNVSTPGSPFSVNIKEKPTEPET